MRQGVIQDTYVPAGYTQLTSLGSAVGVGTIPTGTVLALIQAETQDVRWRDDGTNPTSTVGMIFKVNEVYVYTGNLSALKLIQAAATAKLNISYYK